MRSLLLVRRQQRLKHSLLLAPHLQRMHSLHLIQHLLLMRSPRKQPIPPESEEQARRSV